MVKPTEENEQNEFLKCPNCGCHKFTDWSTQDTSQAGTRIASDGCVDWEEADTIEFSDYFKNLYFECENCKQHYVLKQGEKPSLISKRGDLGGPVLGAFDKQSEVGGQDKWKRIEDNLIQHVWKKADDDDCEDCHGTVVVPPGWYEDNGTPTCGCGQDMVYSHTEILIGKMLSRWCDDETSPTGKALTQEDGLVREVEDLPGED